MNAKHDARPILDAEIRAELDKLTASPLFARSGRLGRFLRFTIEATLSGKSDDLKEYVIGTEVYDRKPPYNPGVDSIVRTEARRLRAKLKEYYETVGTSDPILIYFRPGGYAPLFRRNEPEPAPADSSATEALFSVGAGVSVAVLPFADLSSTPLSTLCARGLTEELSHLLAQTDGIRVAARSVVAQLVAPGSDSSAAAQRLGLQSIIEGSVRQEGNRIRITVQNSSASGFQYSSHRFETLADPHTLPQVQEQVASAFIVRARPALSLIRRRRASASPLTMAAYPLIINAEALLDEGTVADLNTALVKFEDVLLMTPGFARPYCGISLCHTELAIRGDHPSASRVASAKAAALKACELDPEMSDTYACLGSALALEWNWAEAEQAFQRALAVGEHPAASRQFALVLAALGRFDEASHHMDRAQQLDPFSYSQKVGRAKLLFLSRQFAEGVAWLSGAPLHGPVPLEARYHLALMLYKLGHLDDAAKLARDLLPSASVHLGLTSNIAELLALCGDLDRARQISNDLRLLRSSAPLSRFRQATLALALGDLQQSLSFLAGSLEAHEAEMVWLATDPRLAPLRDNSAFREILRSVFPSSPSAATAD